MMTDEEAAVDGTAGGQQDAGAEFSDGIVTEEIDPADDSELPGEEDADTLTAVMLYAGKQYVIRRGREIVLPAPKGFSDEEITVSDILLAKDEQTVVGTPLIEGASASLTRRGPLRLRRELNFKRRRRKNSSMRTKGVRIHSMRCRVDSINIPGLGSQGQEAENTV